MTRNYLKPVDTTLVRLARLPSIVQKLLTEGVSVQQSEDTYRLRLNGVLDWWPFLGTYRKVDGASNDDYMKTREVVNRVRDGL